MKSTPTTINGSSKTDFELQKAQDAVETSLAKFESALAQLADKVEDTSHRVEHVGEMALRSRDELVHLKNSAKSAVQPFIPYWRKGRNISTRTVNQIRMNPKPFFWGVAGLVGAYLAYRSFQKRPGIQNMKSNQFSYDTAYSTGVPV